MIKRSITYKLTILFIGIVIAIVLLVILGPRDTSKIKTKARLTSVELVEKMNTSDSLQLNDYIEKAIEVQGPIKEITYKDGKVTILLDGDISNKLIICEMQSNQYRSMDTLNIGDIVNIKGVFKGVLLDAILLNCILIDKNTNG